MSESVGIRCSLEQAAQWCDGDLAGHSVTISGVSTDSRHICSGNLFIALRGPNHDGHQHAKSAIEKGAVAVMVDHALNDVSVPQLVVSDTLLALGKLAHGWRRQLPVRIAAVTGSNGKTTVKEMLRTILSQVGRTQATQGNLNNDIGVPLTLLALEHDCQYAVVEMGANHPGEIAYLTTLTEPDVALINNAAAAHLEGFASLEGVAHAKGEIYQGLGEHGTAIINGDDTFSSLWKSMNRDRPQRIFSLHESADVSGSLINLDGENLLRIREGEEQISVHFALLGQHNAANAIAAATVARALNIPLDAIGKGLSEVQPVKGRLQKRTGINESTIIDDTYNANPSSLNAGLHVLAEMSGRRYLALGDMAELGGEAEQLHAEAGSEARQLGLEGLYATGQKSRYAAEAFGDGGVYFEKQQGLIDALKDLLAPDVTLLVKGSRSAQMENVVNALVGER